ncbi:MAG: 2-amino-4-hydroxy-6-hydroxymethyldihydropteridine diphosphokinase [Rhizobiaceae bacterium]|nr:2-amino-4-hydroxy-6-hydroxymethyldihydropteridine diphosphokinase [Hyphomicrobiales bacterium]NRB32749.1 2-amino-4-hydroxy-6-hydroxymethyldihydropteridine diphosphokinase [Rhizobiaceae bacterium]
MSAVSKESCAWLGLGGNIGDVKAALQQALRLLNTHPEIAVAKVSPLYKTPPWGVEDQPWFLNCCAQIVTNLSPEDLLEVCQDAERQGKRERTVRWGPRTIDVDIIAFDGVEQVEQRLTIPHPRATQRDFVMIPLADIAPELVISGKSVGDWADAMDSKKLELELESKDWWQT